MPRKNRRNTEFDKRESHASEGNRRPKPFRFLAEPLEDRVLLNSTAARPASGLAENSLTLNPALQTTTAPYIVSINRQSPGVVTTGATSVQYLATFSQPVTGVDASDFAITADPTLTVANPLAVTPVTTSTYTITLSGIKGSGDLSVKFIDNHDIINANSQHLVSMSPATVLSAAQSANWVEFDSNAVIIPDVTGDGKADKLFTGPNNLALATGDGTGNFTSANFDPAPGLNSLITSWAIGDLNGDHIPDFVLSAQDDTLTTYLGTGAGKFGLPQVTHTSIFSPSQILISDFNGDGKEDVLIQTSSGNLAVALSNGTGGFAVEPTVPQSQFSFPIVDDFNGDGRADLLVSTSGGMGVQLGDGAGNFGQPIPVNAPATAAFTLPADFNGDGKLDLPYIDTTSGVGHILSGNGDGTFAPTTTFTAGASQYLCRPADINGDGMPDLLIQDTSGKKLVLLLNNGDGTFQSPHVVANVFRSASVYEVDVDGDGRPDVLAANAAGGFYGINSWLLQANSTVTFASQPYVITQPPPHILSLRPTFNTQVINTSAVQYTLLFDQSVTGVDSSAFRFATQGALLCSGPISVANLGGSAYTVTVNGLHGSGTLTLSLADGSHIKNGGGVPLASTTPKFNIASAAFEPGGMRTGLAHDFNGDGILDLLDYSSTSATWQLALGNGDGTFQSPQALSSLASAQSLLGVGDVNGDGVTDLVALLSDGNAAVLLNNGHGAFAAPALLGVKNPYNYAAIADFNNDGIPDILTLQGNGFVTYLGTRTGQFVPRLSPTLHVSAYNFTIADVNSDGVLDLLNTDYSYTSVFLGNGDGTFTSVPQPQTGPFEVVQFADLNNDGKLDELTDGGFYSPGNGDGTFGAAVAFPTVLQQAGGFIAADFNADGYVDLLGGATQTIPSIYLGTATGFSSRPIPATSYLLEGSRLSITDLNNDGLPDLIFTDAYNYQTQNYGAEIELNSLTPSASSSVTIEQTNPRITSLVKNASQPNPGELDYTMTFSEPVTGVSAAAFSAVTSGSVTAGALTVAAQSSSVYAVAIKNVAGSGSIALAFNDTNVIRNAVGNPLLSNDTTNSYTLNQVTGVNAFDILTTTDLNGDGNVDILGGNFGINAALGNGDGTFQPEASTGFSTINQTRAVDLNNDGKPDLIGWYLTSATEIALGNGDGTFATPQYVDYRNAWDSCDIADVDGDGQLDFVAVSASRHQIATYFGTGAGTFSNPVITTLNSASPISIALGDVNGDGVPDALLAVQNVGAFILQGHKDGTFTQTTTPLVADTQIQSVQFADLNADQKLDVITSGNGGSDVLLGNGDGTFGTDHHLTVYSYPRIQIADVNGDGFADIVQGTFQGNGLVRLGNGDGTFKDAIVPSSLSFAHGATLADFNGDGRPDLLIAYASPDDVMYVARNGSTVTAPSVVGSVSQSNVINLASPSITLTQDADGSHIDWVSGSQVGQVAINSATGLAINSSAAMSTIQLNYAGGNPLPNQLNLNGTFTINGLAGTNPLANTTLDINSSTVYITYAGPAADPLAAIRGYLQNGYNAGLWNGTSTATTGVITSASAAGNTSKTTAIAYADSADGLVPLPANTIELKYTLYGDADLSGQVNAIDLQILLNNFNQPSGTWTRGDFDFSGAANSLDLQMLLNNFNITLPPQAPPPAAAPTLSASLAPTNDTKQKKPAKPTRKLPVIPSVEAKPAQGEQSAHELKCAPDADAGPTGTVGFTDFMRMTQHYTQTGQTWSRGDFNYDGTVDVNDFNLLKPNYGMTLPTPSPDPAPVMTPIVVEPVTSSSPNSQTSTTPSTALVDSSSAKKHVKPKPAPHKAAKYGH